MSVQLGVLKGDKDFGDIEVMAPDYDAGSIWFWPDVFVEDEGRIDMSRDQMRQLAKILDAVLKD